MTSDVWEKRKYSLFFGVGRLNFNVAWLTTPFAQLMGERPPLRLTDDTMAACDAAIIDAYPNTAIPPEIATTFPLIRYPAFEETRFLIDLRGTFALYLKQLPSKIRHNAMGEQRRLREFSNGMLECRTFATPQEMREFRTIAISISDKTYHKNLGIAFDASPAFAESLASDALNERVRGYVLFSNGAPVSYAFCRANGRSLRYVNVAYEPAFRKWSPGNVLLLLMVEELFKDPLFDWLDLEYGSWYDYKRRFATDRIPFIQWWYFPKTIKNLLVVYCHRSLTRALAKGALIKKSLKGILAARGRSRVALTPKGNARPLPVGGISSGTTPDGVKSDNE